MLKLMGVALIGGLILGCSGNSSSTRTVDEEAVVDLGGRVGVSTANVKITAVGINNEGAPKITEDDNGNIVFDGYAGLSDEEGDYEITLGDESVGQTLVFIASNYANAASYRCEVVSGCSGVAYTSSVLVEEDLDIRAGVSEFSDGLVVNLNWLTDLASSLARTVYIDALANGLSESDREDIALAVLDDVDTVKTGVYNEYTIELANLHISKMFGLSDVITIKPIGPSQITKTSSSTSTQFLESIYLGSIVAALPLLAENNSLNLINVLENVSQTIIQRNGQLLQKDMSGNEISLHEIYSTAALLLEQNINYFDSQNARVPSEARTALDKLKSNMNSLMDGKETAVMVDIPSELANWSSNIEKAKEFLVDLTEAINNFWGENPSESSFIDSEHARRVDAYYLEHERLYNEISPTFIGSDGLLKDILNGVGYLIDCKIGTIDCTEIDPKYMISNSDSSVTIDGSLKLTLSPVEDVDNEEGVYTAFDINFSETQNTLLKGSTLYEWKSGFISDGSIKESPYIRLTYSEAVSTPGSLNDNNGGSNIIEPAQITVVWPSTIFEGALSGSNIDAGVHAFNILFEANLIAVSDSLLEATEHRYNPFTVVFWLQSVNADRSYFSIELEDPDSLDVTNATSLYAQIRTSYSDVYYPESKWPSIDQFFNARDDAPEVISDLVTLYRNDEVLNDGTKVEYYDQELIGNQNILRIRLYPYDGTIDATKSESCLVQKNSEGVRDVGECTESILLAGHITLDSLISANYKSGSLTNYLIKANGTYSIDLNEFGDNLVNSDQNFNGLEKGVEYGPYTGEFSEPVMLGVDQSYITFVSNLKEGDEVVPIVVEATLQKSSEDLYSVSLGYAYGQEEEYSDFTDAIGVGIGSNSQGFYLEYLVTEEEILNDSGLVETIDIERGNLNIYRSGINLGGEEQSVLASLVSRVEYPQGNEEFACGVNDSDKLSSAGGCEAVAYLTFRGALLATIREERDGVFVARFVDGSWMVLGE